MFQLQLDFTPEQQQARGANPRAAGITPVSARQPLPPGAGLVVRRTAGAPAAEAREGLGADAELTPVCAHHVATIGLQTPRERGCDTVTLRVTTGRAPGSPGTHTLIHSFQTGAAATCQALF